MDSRACKVKLCGLTRGCDIDWANRLKPDYIGFVFAKGSRRYITPYDAAILRSRLSPEITPVGVFANEAAETAAELCSRGIIDIIQLHGCEDCDYIKRLGTLTQAPVWQAFKIKGAADIERANASLADMALLDSGGGLGKTFDWRLIEGMKRPFFMAGGLTPQNVRGAIRDYRPAGVDASSSLETGGFKDPEKMRAFVRAAKISED